MKRSKPKKSDAQIRKEQAEKEAAKTLAWQREGRRLGRCVRFGFLRVIKAALSCDDDRAETVFAEAVILGQIVKVKDWEGVPVYEMKNV